MLAAANIAAMIQNCRIRFSMGKTLVGPIRPELGQVVFVQAVGHFAGAVAQRGLRLLPQLAADVALVLARPGPLAEEADRFLGPRHLQRQIRAAFDHKTVVGRSREQRGPLVARGQLGVQFIEFDDGDRIVARPGLKVGCGTARFV